MSSTQRENLSPSSLPGAFFASLCAPDMVTSTPCSGSILISSGVNPACFAINRKSVSDRLLLLIYFAPFWYRFANRGVTHAMTPLAFASAAYASALVGRSRLSGLWRASAEVPVRATEPADRRWLAHRSFTFSKLIRIRRTAIGRDGGSDCFLRHSSSAARISALKTMFNRTLFRSFGTLVIPHPGGRVTHNTYSTRRLYYKDR